MTWHLSIHSSVLSLSPFTVGREAKNSEGGLPDPTLQVATLHLERGWGILLHALRSATYSIG